MSSAELLIAQMFLVAAFFISRRLDNIGTIQSVRTQEKRRLWSVVLIFEVRNRFLVLKDGKIFQ